MLGMRPQDLNALGPQDFLGVSAELATRVADKVEQFSAPRDRALAFEFIGRLGPLGRVFLYGAGEHSAELVSVFEDLPGTSIIGFIDRRWKEIGEFVGYEVVGLDRLRRCAFDHVLVANEIAEPEMVVSRIARPSLPPLIS